MVRNERAYASKKRQVAIQETFFKLPTSPQEEPCLLGSRCNHCGTVYFPMCNRCTICFAEDMKNIDLSRKGKIYSYTTIYNAPPGYHGPVPYSVAAVELPEGITILSPLSRCDPNILKIGMDVELVLEKQYDDEEGNEVITYKFRPS